MGKNFPELPPAHRDRSRFSWWLHHAFWSDALHALRSRSTFGVRVSLWVTRHQHVGSLGWAFTDEAKEASGQKAGEEMNPTVFLVAMAAGGLGATLRYVSTAVFTPKNSFPLGVLLSNLVGSFLAGVAAALLTDTLLSPDVAFILVVGFCGGLTTMSSFAVDTVTAMTSGKWKSAAVNISVTTVGSVLLAGMGYLLGITLSF